MNEIQNPSHFKLYPTIYIHYKWIEVMHRGVQGLRLWMHLAIERERLKDNKGARGHPY